MSTAITVRGVSKRYRIGLAEERSETFAGQIMDMVKAPLRNLKQLRSLSRFKEEDESVFWALRDIAFDVQEGEVLGIIGHNGAGKSTLLKILSRITEPTTGEIKINGRVSSLLEVGTGFHPDLTGRENIYMNGTILGMRKKEIDRKLDEIIAFSGVAKYIDTPVKRYSSGMKVRLGFSVAAHLEPDILIIDEVLAVGDFQFQQKCLGKMREVGNSGRTVLFVSHNMSAVSSLCTKTLLLNGGQVKYHGTTEDAIVKYFAVNSSLSFVNDLEKVFKEGVGKISFKSFEIKTDKEIVRSGDEVELLLKYKKNVPEKDFSFSLTFHFYDNLGRRIFICSPNYKGPITSLLDEGTISCRIDRIPLPSGVYTISIWSEFNNEKNEIIEGALTFEVSDGDFYNTGKSVKAGRDVAILMDSNWHLV